MPAYFILIRNSVKDADELAKYGPAAAKTATPELETLAFPSCKITVLEGNPAEAVTLGKFPTMEDALAWYHSDAYQEAMKHRLIGGDYSALVVEGIR